MQAKLGPEKLLWMRLFDVALLLYHMHRAEADPRLSNRDADESVHAVSQRLNIPKRVQVAAIEKALWAANMLDEMGEWWHPRGWSFDRFIDEAVPKDYIFDKRYNTLEKK